MLYYSIKMSLPKTMTINYVNTGKYRKSFEIFINFENNKDLLPL